MASARDFWSGNFLRGQWLFRALLILPVTTLSFSWTFIKALWMAALMGGDGTLCLGPRMLANQPHSDRRNTL
eukprot:1129643-Pyramimonas_sp.AAC.1